MQDTDGLTIEWAPGGRNGMATVTAKVAGEVLAVERFNITTLKARTAFAKVVCDGRPGIDRQVVEKELLGIAAELASKGDGEPPADAANLPELDVSNIARPERFITPEVCGLAVPTVTVIGDKPMGRWALYLGWVDGKRERRSMMLAIELPDKSRLWVHPQPGEPAATARPGWSATARREWLKGSEPPGPADVFKRLCERIAYFLDVPRAQAAGTTATLALWTLLTYVYLAWDAVPYLYLGGPLGSGKSRVFEILSRLVFRPLSSSNMTGAALFRTLHNQGGALLLDEAERLKDTHSPEVGEVMSMLLAGYKRGGQATRLEPIGDTFKTVSFDVYTCKALACVAGLPPALASRCIPIMMFRAAPNSEKPRRRIDADPDGWQSLRDDLHALALEHGATWLQLAGRSNVCPMMDGRDYELWQPLLALAWWIESHGARGLLTLIQKHALAVIDSGKDEQTPGHDETLLKILTDAIQLGGQPTAGEIKTTAQEQEPIMFKNWTARAVAAHLKSYGLITNKSCGRKVYGRVTLDDLRRVQKNYTIDLGFDDEPEPA